MIEEDQRIKTLVFHNCSRQLDTIAIRFSQAQNSCFSKHRTLDSTIFTRIEEDQRIETLDFHNCSYLSHLQQSHIVYLYSVYIKHKVGKNYWSLRIVVAAVIELGHSIY